MRLKELRTEKNVPQSAVAEFLGITQPAYANYERGTRKPDPEILSKLADYFGVSVDYLLGREEHTPTLDEQLEGVDFALSGVIRDLNDSEKQDILDYIRFKKQQKKGE